MDFIGNELKLLSDVQKVHQANKHKYAPIEELNIGEVREWLNKYYKDELGIDMELPKPYIYMNCGHGTTLISALKVFWS